MLQQGRIVDKLYAAMLCAAQHAPSGTACSCTMLRPCRSMLTMPWSPPTVLLQVPLEQLLLRRTHDCWLDEALTTARASG